MKVALALVLVLGSAAIGCASTGRDAPESQSDDATATTYVGIRDFNNAQFQDTWVDIGNKMAGEFANVCGDTFCEGDYSNLTPLGLDCSVSSKAGDVHDCVWTFGGSLDLVDPNTAAFQISAPTYQCHFKPSGRTTAAKLVSFFQSSSDLSDDLPGTTTSVYDDLVDCFQHPIGATPVTVVDSDHPKYVEATDYYTSSSGRAKWSTTKNNLLNGFANICGDTYCDGDFNPIDALNFVCAVTESTGNIKSCNWIFTGSLLYAGSDGGFNLQTKSWTCPVPIKGTIAQLTTLINAPVSATNPSQPIDRPLPGVSTSAYDAIGGCLP